MASSKCSVDGCKRDLDTFCSHCHSHVCAKHYIEHTKLANDQLTPLADQLNSTIDFLQKLNPLRQTFEQLEEWRVASHQRVDELCDEKKRQLQAEVNQYTEQQMKKLRELSQQVKELVDEGDASAKQVIKLQRYVEECQLECKRLEKPECFVLNLKPIEIEGHFVSDLFTGGGTLLSLGQQMKLNEFYGNELQKWVLIYKATRDGFGAVDFHRCCDNQGPTMSVIQSKDGDYLFGGYTSVSWRGAGNYVPDNNGPFLFTLTNPHEIQPTKYLIKSIPNSIFAHPKYGPTFGGHDIHVCDNSRTATTSAFNFPTTYIDTTNRGNATFTGTKNFLTTDIEVYRLLTN